MNKIRTTIDTKQQAHILFSKKRVYGITKLIIFLIILIIVFMQVFNILKRKYPYQKMADFFNQEEDFDVLFFGSSRVVYDIYPMQMWNDYGIISYNMGQYTALTAGSYYNMLLALQYTKPKIIVIDTGLINMNMKTSTSEEHIHNLLDPYPISYTKYIAIKELFEGKNLLNKEMEYLFNFSMYHERWSSLEKEDFLNISKVEKGAETVVKIAKPMQMNDFENVEVYNGKENISMSYLRKIIEYCQENDIKVLVTYMPHPATDDNISTSKYVQVICDKYDVNYINFLSMDIVNYDIDLSDDHSHLNVSGARKVTDYLGKYIVENYDILDQRENKDYSFWYEDYNEYVDYKINRLAGNKANLENYLILLYGEKDIKYEIIISSTLKIEEGSTLQKLLENLGNNYQTDDSAFEEKEGKTIKITTWDNGTGAQIDTVWF